MIIDTKSKLTGQFICPIEIAEAVQIKKAKAQIEKADHLKKVKEELHKEESQAEKKGRKSNKEKNSTDTPFKTMRADGKEETPQGQKKETESKSKIVYTNEELTFQRVLAAMQFRLVQQPFKIRISDDNKTAMHSPILRSGVENNCEVTGLPVSVKIPQYSVDDEDKMDEHGITDFKDPLSKKFMNSFSVKIILPMWVTLQQIKKVRMSNIRVIYAYHVLVWMVRVPIAVT